MRSPRRLPAATGPVVAHCRSGTRSTLVWSLTRMREGVDPMALVAQAAAQRHRHRGVAGAGRAAALTGTVAVAEPRWVSLETVVALNREEVAKTGEPHELLDRAALDIAVKRPWNVWVYFMDQDFATLAMTLLVAIAGARAFAAGNERTAYRAAVALLEANGFMVDLGGQSPAPRNACSNIFADGSASPASPTGSGLWMSPAGRCEVKAPVAAR